MIDNEQRTTYFHAVVNTFTLYSNSRQQSRIFSRSREGAGGNGCQGKRRLREVDVPSVWQGGYQVDDND